MADVRPFDDVRDKLSSYGGIPAGQWREAFKAVYPISSGSPVGVADASWVTPNNNIDFPYVNEDGGLNFLPISGGFGGHWLWLLEEVQKK